MLTTSSLPGFFGPPVSLRAGLLLLPAAGRSPPRGAAAPAGRSPPCRARARAAALLPPEEEEAGETGRGGRSVIRSG